MGADEAAGDSPLRRRAQRGHRGYPIATVAFYGPDDRRASKVAVGILPEEGAEADPLERWHSDERDARSDAQIEEQILAFIDTHGAKSVALSEAILGCPHEEGVDYPEGESCPQCPFWAGRDRWQGRQDRAAKPSPTTRARQLARMAQEAAQRRPPRAPGV